MSSTRPARPYLLLFTEVFPFGKGEAFLETEIDYLAAGFDEVLVVPRRTEAGCRTLPPNIFVDDSLATMHRARSKPESMLRALTCEQLYRELSMRPQTLLQRKAADRLVGHIASALRVADWLQQFTKRRSLPLQQTICYTYWLWVETAGVGLMRRQYPGTLLVSRAHGFDLYAERHDPAYIPMQQFALRSADRVFAVSAHGREYLKRSHPADASRVDLARLGVRDPVTVSARSEDGGLRVVTCSRIEEVKRLDLAVSGIAEFARQHPNVAVYWTHFGDGQLREPVQRAAKRELPSSVQWSFRGEVPNSDVLDHYRQNPVDVLLNVSQSEGVPVSMMEAQSFGVPVIGTAVGGVPEIVDCETGVLLSSDPANQEIAAALSRFVGDEPTVSTIRAASRTRWQTRNSAAINFSRFVQDIQAIG